jgi:large subunit ribosomal protein L31
MRQGIHPEYHAIKIVATNGASFKCGSTKSGDMTATYDKYNHAAWLKGGAQQQTKVGKVKRFYEKYNQKSNVLDLFGGATKPSEVKEGEGKGSE